MPVLTLGSREDELHPNVYTRPVTIAIAHNKGGVSKTTSTYVLGRHLSRDLRVEMVDFHQTRYLTEAVAELSPHVYAMPWTFRSIVADEGATVTLQITGGAGDEWTLRREGNAWRLYAGVPEHPTARVTLDQSIAWRLYTKGITGFEAERHARIHGDDHLGKIALRMVSVIG